jgi:anhydro-N-acetylmuramic acid kinase
MIAVGLMSGTSLDGIDAALVRIRPVRDSYRIDLLNFQTLPFEERLMESLSAILPPATGSVRAVAHVHRELGQAFASAVEGVESDMPIDYVASHGHTVWHEGNAHVTLQLGDPFIIRDRSRASVCYDFRTADCAAGGHGAPLVPYVDALLLRSADEDRVAINLGGIANLTVLSRGSAVDEALAFDSGPGMMLLNAFVSQRSGGRMRFDEEGMLGMRGRVHEGALGAMLADAYFAQLPPKTTGRERFGEQFLLQHAGSLEELSIEDGAATLSALTAQTVADAVRSSSPAGAHLIVSGGGSRNQAVMTMLRERLVGFRVERSDAMNVNPDAKEAIAFALLGYETLRGRPANIPRATGASVPAVLGAIAPYRLLTLLSKVESECRAS